VVEQRTPRSVIFPDDSDVLGTLMSVNLASDFQRHSWACHVPQSV